MLTLKKLGIDDLIHFDFLDPPGTFEKFVFVLNFVLSSRRCDIFGEEAIRLRPFGSFFNFILRMTSATPILM